MNCLDVYTDLIVMHICMIHTGIRGFLNLEDCAIGALHSFDAFNFLSGVYFILVLLSIVLTPAYYLCSSLAYRGTKLALTIHGLVIFLLISTVVIGLGDIVYSFYIASQVYGQFDEFQQGQVNCTSPVYYTSFISVVIVFLHVVVELGLGFILYILLGSLICGK